TGSELDSCYGLLEDDRPANRAPSAQPRRLDERLDSLPIRPLPLDSLLAARFLSDARAAGLGREYGIGRRVDASNRETLRRQPRQLGVVAVRNEVNRDLSYTDGTPPIGRVTFY